MDYWHCYKKKVYCFNLRGKGINTISKPAGKTHNVKNGKFKTFKADISNHYAKHGTWRSIIVKTPWNFSEVPYQKNQKNPNHGKLLVSLRLTKSKN